MTFRLVLDREQDGRWIASVVDVAGATRDEAVGRAMALTFTRLADEVEHGERDPHSLMSVSFSDTAAT